MYYQADFNGSLPKFCQDCGYKLKGDMENYLNINYSDDSHSDLKFIFVTGRVQGKIVDLRFDTETLDITAFPENSADLAEFLFLKTFLIHYAEGRIKIFGKHI